MTEETTPIDSMEDIMSADSIEYATIEGFTKTTTVRIGSLSAGDLLDWVEANDGDAKRTAGLRLICKSLVNGKNERFASDPKNIAIFRTKSHKVILRIIQEIQKLNGLTAKGNEAVKND